MTWNKMKIFWKCLLVYFGNKNFPKMLVYLGFSMVNFILWIFLFNIKNFFFKFINFSMKICNSDQLCLRFKSRKYLLNLMFEDWLRKKLRLLIYIYITHTHTYTSKIQTYLLRHTKLVFVQFCRVVETNHDVTFFGLLMLLFNSIGVNKNFPFTSKSATLWYLIQFYNFQSQYFGRR